MIIIEPCAGLGNRLLALTSAYELAEKLGRELLVIWKSEIGCQIRSEELFLFDGVKVINISESGWKQDFAGTLRGNAVKKKYRGSADRFVECDEVEVWKKEGGFARVEQEIAKTSRIYIKSYTNLCEITPDSFRFLTPSAAVEARGREVFARITKERTVGVHIRRTDHTDAIANSPLELFTDRMKREIEEKDANFYVTTDDARVMDELKQAFPAERLVIYENKVLDRDSREGIQDALVDMLCLSKCSRIIGSYRSTFSLIPSIMGNILLEMMIKD